MAQGNGLPSMDDLVRYGKAVVTEEERVRRAQEQVVDEFQEKIQPLLEPFRGKMKEMGFCVPEGRQFKLFDRTLENEHRYFVFFTDPGGEDDPNSEYGGSRLCGHIVTDDGLRVYSDAHYQMFELETLESLRNHYVTGTKKGRRVRITVNSLDSALHLLSLFFPDMLRIAAAEVARKGRI